MAPVYGHGGPFDENNAKSADYAGRCEAFMVANEIAEDKQVQVCLALVGPQPYKLLKNVCDLENPNSKSYQDFKANAASTLRTGSNSHCRKNSGLLRKKKTKVSLT